MTDTEDASRSSVWHVNGSLGKHPSNYGDGPWHHGRRERSSASRLDAGEDHGSQPSRSEASAEGSAWSTAAEDACTQLRQMARTLKAMEPTAQDGSVASKIMNKERKRGKGRSLSERPAAAQEHGAVRRFFDGRFWIWMVKLTVAVTCVARFFCVKYMYTNVAGHFEWSMHRSYFEGWTGQFSSSSDDHMPHGPDPLHDPLSDYQAWFNTDEPEYMRNWFCQDVELEDEDVFGDMSG